MRRYTSQPRTADAPLNPSAPVASQDDSAGVSFDIEALLDKATIILNREITNLLMESSGKKLNRASAQDLVAYIKLLSELKADKEKELSTMTDEELQRLAQPNQQSK